MQTTNTFTLPPIGKQFLYPRSKIDSNKHLPNTEHLKLPKTNHQENNNSKIFSDIREKVYAYLSKNNISQENSNKIKILIDKIRTLSPNNTEELSSILLNSQNTLINLITSKSLKETDLATHSFSATEEILNKNQHLIDRQMKKSIVEYYIFNIKFIRNEQKSKTHPKKSINDICYEQLMTYLQNFLTKALNYNDNLDKEIIEIVKKSSLKFSDKLLILNIMYNTNSNPANVINTKQIILRPLIENVINNDLNIYLSKIIKKNAENNTLDNAHNDFKKTINKINTSLENINQLSNQFKELAIDSIDSFYTKENVELTINKYINEHKKCTKSFSNDLKIEDI